MEQQIPRDRKSAIVDRKKSQFNYSLKHNSKTCDQRFTDEAIDNKLSIDPKSKDILPKPPTFTNNIKNYSNNKKNTKMFIHERASIVSCFDRYELLDSELSLISLENYLSKFDEQELENLKINDIITFDPHELDSIKKKLTEFLEVAQKLNDGELIEFLNLKIRNVDKNRDNINLLVNNLERVEDLVILDDTLKFFLKPEK